MAGLGNIWAKKHKNLYNNSLTNVVGIANINNASSWICPNTGKIYSNIVVGSDKILRCIGGGVPEANYALFLIDKQGNVIKSTVTSIGVSDYKNNANIVLDDNDNAYIIIDQYLKKYNSSGTLLWSNNTVPFTDNNYRCNNVAFLSNGNVIIGSAINTTGSESSFGRIYTIDPATGNVTGNPIILSDLGIINAGPIFATPSVYNVGGYDYLIGITYTKNTSVGNINPAGTLFCLKINNPNDISSATLVWQKNKFFAFYQQAVDNQGYTYALYERDLDTTYLTKVNILTGVESWYAYFMVTSHYRTNTNLAMKGIAIDSRYNVYVNIEGSFFSTDSSGHSAGGDISANQDFPFAPAIDNQDVLYMMTGAVGGGSAIYCVKITSINPYVAPTFPWNQFIQMDVVTDQITIGNNGELFVPTAGGLVAFFDNAYSVSKVGYGIYVGGIHNDNISYSPHTEAYNPVVNTWVNKTNAPLLLQKMTSFDISRNRGYIVGGLNQISNIQTIHSKTLLEYNLGTDVWVIKTPTGLFEEAQRSSSFVIGSKAYVLGGLKYGSGIATTYLSSNKVWDSFTNAVTTGPSVPYTVFGSAGFSANNKGYVVGGSTDIVNNTVKNNVAKYDPNTTAWTNVSNLAKARQEASAFNLKDTVSGVNYYPYIAGGIGQTPTPFDPSSSMEKMDFNSSTWSTKANLPSARSNVNNSGFRVDDKGYVVKGYNNNQFTPDPLEYNALTNTWLNKSTTGIIKYSGAAFGVDIQPSPDGTFYFTRRDSSDSIIYINDTALNVVATTQYADQMMISNVNDFTEGGNNSGWISISDGVNTIAWNLTSGDGVKTVYVKFKNVTTSQESNVKYSNITLNTIVPHYADVQSHIHVPSSTSTPNISIEIDAPTVITMTGLKIKLSSSNAFTGSVWQDYGTGIYSWTIAVPINSYTNIFYKFLDISGNESVIYSTESLNGGKGIAYGNLTPPAQVTGLTGTVDLNTITLNWLPLS